MGVGLKNYSSEAFEWGNSHWGSRDARKMFGVENLHTVIGCFIYCVKEEKSNTVSSENWHLQNTQDSMKHHIPIPFGEMGSSSG